MTQPLPCPFCGAELLHRSGRTGLNADIWEHPSDTYCMLSRVSAALGDPLFLFDTKTEIELWNRRTA